MRLVSRFVWGLARFAAWIFYRIERVGREKFMRLADRQPAADRRIEIRMAARQPAAIAPAGRGAAIGEPGDALAQRGERGRRLAHNVPDLFY